MTKLKTYKIISSPLFNWYTLENFLCFDDHNKVIYNQFLDDLGFKPSKEDSSVYKSDTIKNVHAKLGNENLKFDIFSNNGLLNKTQIIEFANLKGINDYMASLKHITSIVFNT
jgi:hypothetical protein